jgi:hypothetical protein
VQPNRHIGCDSVEQDGRLLTAETADLQGRQVGAVEQRRLALADGEENRDRVGQ